MKLYSFILCTLILLTCCKKKKDEIPPPPAVKHAPTLTLISAEIENNDSVRIKGKVISADWLENPVYGIVYSADSIPTVNSEDKIILGNISDSAQINYTIKNLSRWKNYNFRLFLTTEKETWYSLSKQVITPAFQLAPFKDSVISRNTLLKVYFTEPIPVDQRKGFEVYVGDKKIDSMNVIVESNGTTISFLVPIDYKQGSTITIKKGIYSQSIVCNLPVLSGYWKRITPHEGYLADNAAYFTLGNKGYIIGGNQYPSATETINTVWEIDLSTYQWKKKNAFPVALQSAMAVTVNNKAYLFGGVTYNTLPNHRIYEYDPVSDNWQVIDTMAVGNFLGRLRMSVAVYNNKIYMGGGIRFNGSINYEYWFTQYWVTFDPVTRIWEDLPRFPNLNSIQSMTTYTYNNQLYLFGGDDNYHESRESFALDFSNNTWSKPDLSRSLPPRTGVSVINKNNSTYFFGGYQYKQYYYGESGGRFAVMPEFWKTDDNHQFTQLASASTSEFISVLNRNAPIFATAKGFIVYDVLTWNGNNSLNASVIEYIPE